jgi:hypothetical protein
VTRSWKALLLLLAAQEVLSVAAMVVTLTRSCASCLSWGAAPGIAGSIGYAGLLVLALARGPSRLVFAGILFAFGVHAALTLQMVVSGFFCGLCLAATAGSLILVVLSVAVDPRNVGRLGIAVPWAVLLTAGTASILRPRTPVSEASAASVSIVVFTQEDCAYCDELRDRVMPEIEKEFGPRVQIDYRPASDLPAVRKTPTLILTPKRTGIQGRVIEGLPTVERLRGAIHDLETRS